MLRGDIENPLLPLSWYPAAFGSVLNCALAEANRVREIGLPEARWVHLEAQARQSTIGQLVDDAMAGIERDNSVLEGVLPRDTPHRRLRLTAVPARAISTFKLISELSKYSGADACLYGSCLCAEPHNPSGEPVIEPFPDQDMRVRLASFRFLDEQIRLHGEVLPLSLLREGFTFDGRRVPIMSGTQGIFKPAVLAEMPLSIYTSAPNEADERPYDDVMTDAGLLYRYRGSDRNHRDNVGVRLAMVRQRPLIYLHGIVPGQYFPEWPLYVVGDDPALLTFTINIDDRQLAAMQARPEDEDQDEAAGRRRYVTRVVQQRAHQAGFRLRVIEAYRRHCAICRLRHQELLDAAHILPDGHPLGEPIVPNGLALCSLHHSAFDANILGVTPDFKIEIRKDVLSEKDGPMLIHGLQTFHGVSLELPQKKAAWPRRDFLEERYLLFRKRG